MLGNILAVGLMSMGMGLSGIKDEPNMYAQNAETYTIVYESAEDWSSRAETINEWLIENNYTYPSGGTDNSLAITATISNYSSYAITKIASLSETKIWFSTSSGQVFNYDISTEVWGNFMGGNFTLDTLTITSQTYYEGLAEEEPVMGNDIVGTIASGLGIIGALATTFLTGFGNLFYSSGALTPFAIFALVMLGIAVSFAVVKLVLNIIRSNTGA